MMQITPTVDKNFLASLGDRKGHVIGIPVNGM
jgi:hypothetical protein